MKWNHEEERDGLKVITSDKGYLVRDLYETMPNGDTKQLFNPDGKFICSGKSYAGLQLYAGDLERIDNGKPTLRS